MQNDRSEESIFAEAISKNSFQMREKFLDEACRGDLELRTKLEQLIVAHNKSDSFIDDPESISDTQSVLPKSIGEGETIGRYKLLQQIGEGGFGIVFMAEQVEPVRRRVALKIIKPGMDSKEVIARFEAERQALAMMEHPNIAKVLDAGKTDTGHPYFVMELVKGVPVTNYADDNQLATRERLKLFVQICRAIQHAHQKGVIHRDLKPSNVMVTLHDGVPVPKVIDFGVSKALNQQLTEKTLFTRYGQIIGTPQYMSPEQAEISGLDIDTRSDVYSLGVLLYELLTGRPPFDAESLREAGFDEMRRIIREKEPMRPSDRLLTLDKETATTVAKSRSSQPSALSKFVKGELDWIVMRSLEKSRERRFDSAGAFADEIQRHLNGEIVQTSAPSRLYVAWKVFNRHRSLFLTTATLFIVLASAAVVSLLNYQAAVDNLEIAYRSRKKAENAQQEMESANDQLRKEQQVSQSSLEFLTEFIASSDAEVMNSLLEKSRSYFGDNPATEYEVLKQITASLIRERELPVSACERLVTLASSVFGKGSREYSLAILELGNVSYDVEKVKAGITNEKKCGRVPTSKMLCVLGMFLVRDQKYTDAIDVLEQAVESYDRTEVAGPYYDIPHLWLSEAYRETGQEDKYKESISIGIDELISFYPEAEYDNWRSESSYCVSDLRRRDLRWPIQTSEWAALAALSIHESTDSNQSLHNGHEVLGQSYRCSGQTRKAVDSNFAAIKAAESILLQDKRTFNIGFRLATIGRAFRDVGDYQKQEEYLEQAMDVVEVSDSPFIKFYLPFELALVKLKLEKPAEFEPLAERTYTSLLSIVSDESQSLWSVVADWYVFAECAYLLRKKVPKDMLQELIDLQGPDNAGDKAGLNFAQGFALAMMDDWDAALLKFEEGMTKGCDYSFATSELTHIEDLVLDKMVERNEIKRATDLIKALVDFKQQTMSPRHPQIGLSKLRYATFLHKNKAKTAFAKRILVEAKEQLIDHPLLPTKYLEQIEHLMNQLDDVE